MCSYTTEKLEHLFLIAMGSAWLLVMAYLLQETHLPASTMLLYTPMDYQVL